MKKVNKNLGQQLLMASILLIVGLFLQSCDTGLSLTKEQNPKEGNTSKGEAEEIGELLGKDALTVDPTKVVVVCISGFQFQSSSLAEQKQELIEDLKAIAKEEKGELPSDFDYDKEAEKIMNSLDETYSLGGQTGMQKLRNKLANRLATCGVPASNIIYRKWTTAHRKHYKDQPQYDKIVDEINAIDPSYLAIVGHSYGGCTAARISRVTTREPDFVDFVCTILQPTKTSTIRMK